MQENSLHVVLGEEVPLHMVFGMVFVQLVHNIQRMRIRDILGERAKLVTFRALIEVILKNGCTPL